MPNKCLELGIPEYLHQKERPVDSIFQSEFIYRRYKASGNVEDWKKDKVISASIFPVKNDSCNRSKYCRVPEDVLYNTREEDKGNHYFEMGILSVNSDSLIFFSGNITQNGNARNFQLTVSHEPLECMYPHCEILVMENGQVIDQKKPKSIKALIRDLLLDEVEIAKMPDMKNT